MAKYLKRYEEIAVSHVFVADLWREHGLNRHRQDTFKLSKDPLFAEKVADIVGPYLPPPAGAVELSGPARSMSAASSCWITAGIACRTPMFTSWPYCVPTAPMRLS
jgi:hypothetical protein